MQITTNRGLEYVSVLLCPKEKNIGGWHSIPDGCLDWPPRHATPSADCHSYEVQSAEKLLPMPIPKEYTRSTVLHGGTFADQPSSQ